MSAVSVAGVTSEIIYEIGDLLDSGDVNPSNISEMMSEELGIDVDFQKLQKYSFSKLQRILNFLENLLIF